ncbi:keratin-associated protein 19-2-like [Cinclus cinclus]|uniref:keratin-associated protein 19-2-like n=1 Tax=Cinclus cinclus TaxID=127875 RepID=UPI002E131EF9
MRFLVVFTVRFYLHLPKMTFLQSQCEDDCYSSCNYGGLYGYRGYDCGSPCGYRGYGSLYSSRGLYGFGDRYGYGGLYGYRGIFGSGDCYGSGGLYGGYRGYGYGSGDCYGYPGFYSGRYGYPFGSRYGQRFGYGGCYSC